MPWRLLLGIGLLAAGAVEQPGRALEAGMVLTYQASGEQSTWRVDSVRLDSVPHCGVVWLTRVTTPERRHHCSDGVVLSELQRDGSWTSVRPVAAPLERSVRRANGNVVTYRSTATAIDTISGVAYPVVLTEVTTADSVGHLLQRLSERYSVGLTTATYGVFERPDPSGTGWKTVSEFRLVSVGRP